MSWIILDGAQILTGQAGTALGAVFGSPAATALAKPISLQTLNDLLGTTVNANEKNAITLLTDWIGIGSNDDIDALFTPVDQLSQSGKDARAIGWPSETYKKNYKVSGNPSFNLSAEADGTFAFTLGEAAAGDANVKSALEISGNLGTKASSEAKVSKVAFTLNANFKFATGATWSFERPNNNDLTGVAVAEALGASALAPNDLQEMEQAPSHLKSVQLTKALNYGTDANAKVSIPIDIGGITFGLNVGYQNADKLVLVVTRDADDLQVKIDVSESDIFSVGYSLGVKIATPDIVGDIAKKVTKKIKGASDFLASPDVEKLLQPSKLIVGKIKPLVLSEIKLQPKMATALTAILDRDNDQIAETLDGLLSSIIDDIIPLDRKSGIEGKILDQALDRLAVGLDDIKKDISDGLGKIIKGTLDDLYDEIPSAITDVVNAANNDEELEKAIKDLIGKKANMKGVKAAITAMRKKLNEIAKVIEDAVNDGLSMSFSYKKVNAKSTTATGTILFPRAQAGNASIQGGYQALIDKPLSTLDAWLPNMVSGTLVAGSVPAGVNLNDVELFERWSSQTDAKQSLSMAKLLIANEQARLSKFFIHRSANGVIAGARSAVKESSFWFGSRRQVEWEGLFGHIDPKDKTTVRQVNPNQIIHIGMTHAEGTLEGDEIDRVFAPFEALNILDDVEVDALRAAAQTEQTSKGVLKGSVSLRMAFTKADFNKMLAAAFPDASDDTGDPALWQDIAYLYFDALEDAIDFRTRKVYRQAYGFRGNVAQALGIDASGATNYSLAADFMAHSGDDLETFENEFGVSMSYSAIRSSVERKARKHAGRLFLAPREVRSALYNCMTLNSMLENDPDRDEAARLQSSITRSLSRAIYVDASSDAVTPWSAGLFGAFLTMAEYADVTPGMQLRYKSG